MNRQISIFKDSAELAEAAAKHFVSSVKEAIASRGRFSVALAGGSTPKLMYQLLAGSFSSQVEWAKVFVFWNDERFVPHNHPDSNYLMAKEALLQFVPIPPENVFPIPTEGVSVDEAAAKYSKTLTDFFGSDLPHFDLMILGMGTDGHTASLFPNSPTLNAKGLVAAEKHSPKSPSERITLTYPVINNSQEVMIMVSGADKVHVLKEVLEGEKRVNKFPVQGVDPKSFILDWYIDKDAASELKR